MCSSDFIYRTPIVLLGSFRYGVGSCSVGSFGLKMLVKPIKTPVHNRSFKSSQFSSLHTDHSTKHNMWINRSSVKSCTLSIGFNFGLVTDSSRVQEPLASALS